MARRCRSQTRAPARKKKQNGIRAVALHHPGNKVAQEGAKMQRDFSSLARTNGLGRKRGF